MNFLALCKDTALDSGVIAGIPSFTTVAAPTGRIAQLVGWVRNAWIDIQNERNDWIWMRRRFAYTLSTNQTKYTAANLGLTRVGAYLRDDERHRTFTVWSTAPELGRALDEGEIEYIPLNLWVEMYERGDHDAQRPRHWSVDNDGQLLIGPKPDRQYGIAGEYRVTPQELQADTDIPEMPAQFHRVIIGEALRLMHRSDEAVQALALNNPQYNRLRNALVREQTPEIIWVGEPLA